MMMHQTLLLLGLLTATEGFGSSLSVSRIGSSLAQTIQHAKPLEFSFEDDNVRPSAAQVKRSYIPPPEFTIEDDDYDVPRPSPVNRSRSPPPEFTIDNDDVPPPSVKRTRSPPPQFSDDDDDGDSYSESRSPSKSIQRPKRKTIPSMKGSSWMEKNAQFSKEMVPETIEEETPRFNPRDSPRVERGGPPSRDGRGSFYSRDSPRGGRGGPASRDGRGPPSNNFRQNFRATRVFVQGIPPGTSWQDLKDHFKVAGAVVFASVSVDIETGESRGHGIVQFEEPEMAENAIKMMREHPLNGSELYVREDVQENKNGASMQPKGPTPPTKWKCANEDNAAYLDEAEIMAIRNLIKARDDARRRRKYDVSDRIRDELKETHGVFIDDRLQMWWTSVDGSKVPQSIHDIKGDGRWKVQPWRQIPTTPENDACVNPDLVAGLLNQRDIARREKDFRTADALLEEARTAPDGDLNLRIHDESRTWRVWTEAPPAHLMQHREDREERDPRMSAAEQCMQIVEKHAPHKIGEIKMVLEKFKGREFQVLKRLKTQYEL